MTLSVRCRCIFAGAVGVIMTAFVAVPAAVPEGGRFAFAGIQVLGVASCFAWAYGVGLLVWWLVGKVSPLRVGEIEEKVGLNYTEHQVPDPLGELTTAVGCVARGESVNPGTLTQLDDAGYGALGRALSVIMERKPASMATTAWVRELDRVRFELEAQLVQQAKQAASWPKVVGDVQQKMQRILDYLADHNDDSTAVPILHDLLQNLYTDFANSR